MTKKTAGKKMVVGHGAPNKTMGKKILWLVTSPAMVMSFYRPLLLALRDAGFELHLATNMVGDTAGAALYRWCQDNSQDNSQDDKQDNNADNRMANGRRSLMGNIYCYHWSISRGGRNPLTEWRSLVHAWLLCRRIAPDMVNAITLKAVLYGGLAARFSGRRVLGHLTGLGFVFISRGWLARLVRLGLRFFLPFIFNHGRNRLLVMNSDDQQLMAGHFGVKADHLVRVAGVGVDSDFFSPTFLLTEKHKPQRPLRVVTMARLLHDKGIVTFCRAAMLVHGQMITKEERGKKLLTKAMPPIEFFIYGDRDGQNPSGLSLAEVKELEKKYNTSGVRFMGHVADQRGALAAADVVVLWSRREGLPQVLAEAAALQKPLIALDAPGSRAVCRHGRSGLLVSEDSAIALAWALEKLLRDAGLRKKLGAGGRRLVLAELSQAIIHQKMLRLFYQMCA